MMNTEEMLQQMNPTVTVVEATNRWQGDTGSIRPVSTGSSFIFRFEKGGDGYYLRMQYGPVEERKTVSAVRYLEHLWREGAQVCEPVVSREGRMVESIPAHPETEILPDGGYWLATVVRESPGNPAGEKYPDGAVSEAWGRCLGTLHRAARTFSPRPEDDFGKDLSERYAGWQQSKQNIPTFDILALQEYERLDAWYRSLPATEGHPDFGTTHSDCNEGNYLWDGRTVTAVDFEHPKQNWFVADIARSLIFFEWKEPRHPLRAAFLRGYRSVCDFSPFWEENLPAFMRLFGMEHYIEHYSYPTPEALAEADAEGVHRPWDFNWCCRKRFADPTLWN